jgi:hypothetical protein
VCGELASEDNKILPDGAKFSLLAGAARGDRAKKNFSRGIIYVATKIQ